MTYLLPSANKNESIVYCDEDGCPIKYPSHPKGFIHSPFTLWLYGLSGSGKTVVGRMLFEILRNYTNKVVFIDANELRKTVCQDLGYSLKDRHENVRRVAYMAWGMNRQDISVIVAMTTALKTMRNSAKRIVGNDNCHFIYISTPPNVCLARDPKRIYSKRIPFMSGIDDKKFEEPDIDEPILFNLDTSVVTKEEIHTILTGFVARRILRGEDDGKTHKYTCKGTPE